MKIAFLSRWNATCGVSLHAELLCRRLSAMGHGVLVFAPRLKSANKDWHHKKIKVRDEKWVLRVYDETTEIGYPYGGEMDRGPLLEEDYDVLVVEVYARFPLNEFSELADELRRRCKLVGVLHLSYRRDIDPLLRIKWDGFVFFDERYYNELLKGYDLSNLGKLSEIPYPCAIVKNISAERPEFAENLPLFFTYGRQPYLEYIDYIQALRKLLGDVDFKYFVIRSDQQLPIKESWIIQVVDRPSLIKIYRYLMGADIHLLPKGDTKGVVVSSTVAQCLHSGTPTIVPDTRYFETIPVDERGIGPVVKYRIGDADDLLEKIRLLVSDEKVREEVAEKARQYALENSEIVVTRKFLEFVNSL